MDIQLIKKTSVISLIVFFKWIAVSGQPSNIDNTQMIFKMLSYKQQFNLNDYAVLYVKNITDKPLYYVIGRETHFDNHWIAYEQDIKLDPSQDLAATYEILGPHQFKKLNVSLKRTGGTSRKSHGVSQPSRFYLKYHDLNKIINKNETKILTKVFTESW